MKLTYCKPASWAPLNSNSARFGGGWHYKVGFQGSKTKKEWLISLLFWEFRVKF